MQAAILLLALSVTATAMACPSCKEALAAGDPERAHLVRGFFWSILFMLSMPFLLLTSFCTYMYVLVRRAKLEKSPIGAEPSGSAMAFEG
jgi:heme/copper-type cytochrome/quinol oxidase subunit 2